MKCFLTRDQSMSELDRARSKRYLSLTATDGQRRRTHGAVAFYTLDTFCLQVFVLRLLLCSRRSLHRIVPAFIKDSFSLWSHGPEQYAVDRRQGGQPF